MSGALILLLTLGTSLLAAPVIFLLPERAHRTRTAINLGAALLKLALVAWMVRGLAQGAAYRFHLPVMEGFSVHLVADPLGILFAGLSSLLWVLTTLYAVAYLEASPNRRRFFGFFSLCVASTLGIALAANLFTFLIFYELLTLATYPLVVHRGTPAALAAGRIYLRYTVSAGFVLLLGVVWLQALAGELTFGELRLSELDEAYHPTLQGIFLLLMLGLGVKAALVPLHGWLPQAMVAPAPVSALLHAVAVVKAGAFGIVRLVYDVYGIAFSATLGLLGWLTAAASLTILYGSLRALAQSDLKRRLAFSTVSQVAYIVLGVSLFGPLGTLAGLAHLLHQGLMKVTLFFCAGNYAEELGIHRVDELDGAGRRMPLTSLAFTLGALGMIGLPPLAGFISKWYLGMGAVAAGSPWVIAVLVASSLLNAAYFLPPIYRLWFKAAADPAWPQARCLGRFETHGWLWGPALATGLFSLLAGLLAGLPYSPLDWAGRVVGGEYFP